jgi:hypothetical protein
MATPNQSLMASTPRFPPVCGVANRRRGDAMSVGYAVPHVAEPQRAGCANFDGLLILSLPTDQRERE